eukprot:scaffold9737_cov72-Phaeocystis_antarctica.AAC.5
MACSSMHVVCTNMILPCSLCRAVVRHGATVGLLKLLHRHAGQPADELILEARVLRSRPRRRAEKVGCALKADAVHAGALEQARHAVRRERVVPVPTTQPQFGSIVAHLFTDDQQPAVGQEDAALEVLVSPWPRAAPAVRLAQLERAAAARRGSDVEHVCLVAVDVIGEHDQARIARLVPRHDHCVPGDGEAAAGADAVAVGRKRLRKSWLLIPPSPPAGGVREARVEATSAACAGVGATGARLMTVSRMLSTSRGGLLFAMKTAAVTRGPYDCGAFSSTVRTGCDNSPSTSQNCTDTTGRASLASYER